MINQEILDEIDLEVEYKRPPKDSVCIKEVIELFVVRTIYEIDSEIEIPKFNIIFDDKGMDLLEKVKNEPYQKIGYFTPDISQKDMEKIRIENQNDINCPTIIVKDAALFFELLTNIINEQIKLNYIYGENSSARAIALQVLRRIWLRMEPDDFLDIELFLQKQLDFLKNLEFDMPRKEQRFKEFDYKIVYEIEKCETWCESTRRIVFKIFSENEIHELPKIYYDIREENNEPVCYIYAVQNGRNKKTSKKIERYIYTLNKNINNDKIHPNFLMAIKLFNELLRMHNITHVKAPIFQVLSYRYHELLSDTTKRNFDSKWDVGKMQYMDFLKTSSLSNDKREYEYLKKEYENDKIWYEHVVDKADFISKAKTENLIYLFTYMTFIDDIDINTIPFINYSYLDITLHNKTRLSK